jgi:hypothetical protein
LSDWTLEERYREAKVMAEKHWSYVRGVVESANPDLSPRIVELLGFHYKTAFIHGYGHGLKDRGERP